jgi:hypothetical protein
MERGKMPGFTSFENFFGTYVGSYDGRQAQLIIKSLETDGLVPKCQVTFIDIDRNQTYKGTAEEGDYPHILSDLVLYEVGGQEIATWSKLFLHNWNISYISGVSVWNDIEFGMFFTRVEET